MSDLLTRQLHDTTDRLPVTTPAPAELRARAVRRHRQRVTTTAVLTAIAVLAGAGALMAGNADQTPAPPASPTPEPTVSGPVLGTIGLERFLLPQDLPTGMSVGAWTDRHETRDLVGGPVCSTMQKGDPVRAMLVEFAGESPGLRAYQSVAYYSTTEAAAAALAEHRSRIAYCTKRFGSVSGDGYVILQDPAIGNGPSIEGYARVGRFVSRLYLTGLLEGDVRSDQVEGLIETLRDRLDGTSRPPGPSADPLQEALAAALLSAEVAGGSMKYDDVYVGPVERELTALVAHPCAAPGPGGDVVARNFIIGEDQVLAMQRLVLAADEDEARQLLADLTPDCGSAGIADRFDQVEQLVLRYPARVELDREATIHVSLLRIGRVVTEVVVVDRAGDEVDHGAQLSALVEAAIARIKAHLPDRPGEDRNTTSLP